MDVPRASYVLPGYMPYVIYNNMFGASNVLPTLKFSGLRFESLHDPLDPCEPYSWSAMCCWFQVLGTSPGGTFETFRLPLSHINICLYRFDITLVRINFCDTAI